MNRRPGSVPDEPDGDVTRIPVDGGSDTDGDGTPDTLLIGDGADLLVHVDIDGDGFADRLLRIDAEAGVRAEPAADSPADGPADGAAVAVPVWSALLGRLLGYLH